MNPLYEAALNGTLKSNPIPTRPFPSLTITSVLPFSVYVYSLSTDGKRVGWMGNNYAKGGNSPYLLDTPQQSFSTSNVLSVGDILLIVAAHSGGFFAVIELTNPSQTKLTITSDYQSDPNDIGPVPKPTKQVLIPPDSPRVVVGCGNIAGQNSVVREQYWRRLPDSYSLAPGATKEVSYTVTSGMQSTTSQQDTISTSLGLNVSGGWGPISASISASLSTNSTTFQQQTFTSQTTSFTSTKLTNSTKVPQTLLLWQLTDVVTIFDAKRVPLGCIITGGEPVIIYGPYNPLELVERLPLVTTQELLGSHDRESRRSAVPEKLESTKS
ncbi:MAG: hypothetical protein M3Z24_09735 [Chloroflexota bacterium]|nr:hypothetical protein [Chloroflexota bacterium]